MIGGLGLIGAGSGITLTGGTGIAFTGGIGIAFTGGIGIGIGAGAGSTFAGNCAVGGLLGYIDSKYSDTSLS